MAEFDYMMPDDERKRAAWMALAQASAGLLGAPRGREWQALGQGVQQGLLSYGDAQSQWQKQQMAKQHMAMQQEQLAQQRQQWAHQQQQWQDEQRRRAGTDAAAQAAIIPGQPGMPEMGPPTQQGAMQPAVAPTPQGFDFARYANAVAPINPQAAMQIQQGLAKEAPFDKPKMEHWTPESRARYELTRQSGDLVPVAAKTEQWREIGRTPSGQILMENVVTGDRKAVGSGPQSVTNVNMPRLETEEAKAKGQANVKYASELKAGADAARKEYAILANMAKNPVETGAGLPLASTVAGWLTYAGMGNDRVKQLATNSQTFTRDAMDLVLQKQLAQKGPQTESDAKRLEQSVASSTNTKEANAKITAFAMAQAKRSMQQQQFYDAWWSKNRTYEGADAAWYGGRGGASLYEEPELKQFQAGGGFQYLGPVGK